MKKTVRKLVLAKETLKVLESGTLQDVEGGAMGEASIGPCTTTYEPCQ